MKLTKLFKRLLMVAVMMALLPQNAAAWWDEEGDAPAYDFMVDNLFYRINSDNTSVTVTDGGSVQDLAIPETVTYNGTAYSVTAIGNEAFCDCWLTSLTIGNNVTSIGGAAFRDCGGLTSVTIPNSVTSIGGSAFAWCTSLTSVTIPNSIISIGPGAFDETPWYENQPDGLVYVGLVAYKYKCEMDAWSATAIELKDGTVGIADRCFNNCSRLKSVTIPNSVAYFGSGAFSGCSGLTSINIPNSVTSIGSGAFSGCSSLVEVTIPDSVTSVGGSAFSGTAWYNNLPDGLVYIGLVAYKYKGIMPSGTNIEIKEGTTEITPSCFTDCIGLTAVTIPNSVTAIGGYAFSGCSGLTEVTIPNSVTEICSSTFKNCNRLISVTIGNSVTSIGYQSFYGCSGLTSVTIGPSVTIIDYEAFRDCSGLTEVTIPNSVQSLGFSSFAGCSGLTSVTIGNSVTTISDQAFYDCSGLSGSLIIPNSVTSIGISAFQNCGRLTSMTIGNSVTTIGDNAFSGCSGLTSVTWNAQCCTDFTYLQKPFSSALTSIQSFTFGDDVQRIPAYLCYNMTGLTSMTIGNSVTTIGEHAFHFCRNLTTMNLPNSVITIGDEAFRDCSGLTGTLTIPNSVTTIGQSAFQDCSGLTSVIIGNSIKSIGYAAFYLINGSVDDRTLILNGGIETIDDRAFGTNSSSNRNFTTLVLKGEVVNIKNLGTNPSSIYSYATTPPECDANTFKSYDATLHVPASAMAAYFEAPYWLNFANIVGDAVEPTSLTLNVDTSYIELGSQLTLQYTLLPSNATNVGMQWTTSDASIATVNNNGTVSALQPGECDITVTCADLVARCHLVVLEQLVTITLDHHALEMEPNTIQWLTPSFAPVSTDITASSSNTDVALVKVINGRMQVLAMEPGRSVVTVRSVDGNAVPDSCVVIVLNPALHGDINNDGLVDIADVNLVINVMLGFDIPTGNQGGNLGPDDSEQMPTGDLNGDGSVDIFDVNLAINAMLGKNPHPTPPNIFTVNGVSFNMIEVEGGTFTMGGTAEQGSDAKSNELPTHQVSLSSYSIGQTEVTQELWLAVMGTNPSEFTGDLQRPVENVSWNDCQTFITKLNQLTGMNFRLPTEAEWEYAARGGNRSQSYKYAGSNTASPVAWYSANAYDVGNDSPDYGTHTVATKAPNELALYDMSGNVWEWCQDWYGDYSSDAQVNPTGPDTGTAHVYRGGSWNSLARRCRVSRRDYNPPTFLLNHLGLRLAL